MDAEPGNQALFSCESIPFFLMGWEGRMVDLIVSKRVNWVHPIYDRNGGSVSI